MDNNGSDDKKISGNDAAPTTIEIKIRSCQTHRTTTLRVDKCIRVSALKEQIAVVTGVVSDRQCLIYSGSILRDNKLLSDYHVEDGDTVHMVTQENISNPRENDPGSSSGHSQGSRSATSSGRSQVLRAYDLIFANSIASAVVGHFVNVNPESGNVELQPSGLQTYIRMTRLGSINMHGYVPSALHLGITIARGAHTTTSYYYSHTEQNGSNTMAPVEDGVTPEGFFLSNLLRHIWPVISANDAENDTGASNTTPTIPPLEDTNDAENRSNDGSAQVQENIEQATSSDAQLDQPESKRQKQE